ENERLSMERDKTLADLGTWQDQISRHEGEVQFASFVKGVMCMELEDACKACLDAQKLLADIQSKNLSTKDMHAELENNKLGPSQIEQLNCVRDCLQALVEGSNEVISNEQKSIDELAQASKHGKDKVAEFDGQIMNGVGEMMRSQNKIIKIEKVLFEMAGAREIETRKYVLVNKLNEMNNDLDEAEGAAKEMLNKILRKEGKIYNDWNAEVSRLERLYVASEYMKAGDGAAEDTYEISLDIKRTDEMIDEYKNNLEEAHESLSQIVVTEEALLMFEYHDEKATLLKAEFIQVDLLQPNFSC
ncbi:hypothetical protein Tco_1048560, partial [Tanacetum coccineum]